MAWAWEELVKYYDKLWADGKPICPIAHTYVTAHLGVLINTDGDFLAAMIPEVKGELTPVPCTAESETRTSGISPHLISDQIQYVGIVPGKEKKHAAYIKQLKDYTEANKNDIYAKSVYKYLSKNTFMDDIDPLIKVSKFAETMNIIFEVYELQTKGIDLDWASFYTSKLPKNGRCSITGNLDYIPDAYPGYIISPNDPAKLFMGVNKSYTSTTKNNPGYIASQKIIHALQYIIYGHENYERVKAKYEINKYLRDEIAEDDLKEWIEKRYPGKRDTFIKILKSGDVNSQNGNDKN